MSERDQDYIGGPADEHGVTSWWRVGRLWALSRPLPVQRLPLSMFADFLDNKGLLGGVSTNRQMAERARRIMEADLSYPIILSASDWIMDGHHRLLKAVALGWTEIPAVQFSIDPEPDERSSEPV